MKAAIAAGIGLFIAFIGLKNSGLVDIVNNTPMLKMQLGATKQTVFLIGLAATGALLVLKARGAILWGIVIGAVASFAMGLSQFKGLFSTPPDPMPVFAQMDVAGVFEHFWALFPLLIIFLYMDVFDTLGTLVGVGTQAGLVKKDGSLENAERAFASDAAGTVFGSVAGHSTVTAFIESDAGVEQGGRTGFVAVVVAICFLLAAFIAPLVEAISSCAAISSPALVIVGVMMMRNVAKIEWDDITESIPAFLVLTGIPFCYSIGDGMILGFVLYPLIKLFSGRAKEAGWLNYALAATLVLYVVMIKK
jgi:AGZA family xanthine/uracil permease-like MFS transporter